MNVKSLVLGVLLLWTALLCGPGVAVAGASPYENALNAGLVHEKNGKFAEARAEFEKALVVEGLTPDQTGLALVKIGASYISEKKVQPGIVALDKARALKGISNPTRIQANLLFGQTYLAYPWVLPQARDAFVQVLALPETTAEQRVAAQKGLVQALMGLRQFSGARAMMTTLAANTNLPPAERLARQIAIGTTCVLEKKYPEARTELAEALAMEGVSDAQKAAIQLQIGLSYYEEKDFERARPELQKVLTMPGVGTAPTREDGMGNYIPSLTREASLRLRTMGSANERESVITVLFIGSSMTLRGYMFQLVEDLAAAAPVGRPRIMSAIYGRGGTGIEVFWEDGETADTARGRLASMPWDVVVLETSVLRAADSNLKYGRLFCDFARSKNIKPVIYESQVKQDAVYPGAHRKFHDDEMLLVKAVQAPLAPVVLAQMHYLEATPAEQIGTFYADWIHPSEKGSYLAAYCLYSTITGYSPVGLTHPESISKEDAKALQEAAWKAVQETNPDLKPYRDNHGKESRP